jgi:hypothetical protein
MSMSSATRRWAAGLVVAVIAAVPSTASAANVAFFNNATYVDIANPGGEATNLDASLIAAGHTVNAFTGITAADLTTALAGQDAIVIPEQEKPGAGLQADLLPDAKQVLRDFVSAGGNLVTFAQHKAVLDAIFGYSIGTTGPIVMGGNADKQPIAASTPYGGGPTTLAPNSAVYGMLVSALPPAAKVVYKRTESALDYGVVVLIPYGAGTITYFGWDWYNSNPPQGGGADGGWQNMLSLATNAAGLTPPDMSAGDVAVAEGTGGTTTASVPASYATADGTAIAGEDYTAATGTVTFAVGEQAKAVPVAVTPDAAVEPAESFSLTLSAPSGATLVDATGVVTITDDDVAPPPPPPPRAALAPAKPAPKVCKSNRVVRIHVRVARGAKLRATIAGKKVAARNGTLVVDLRDRPAGSYRVVIRNAKGRVLTKRTLRTCVP